MFGKPLLAPNELVLRRSKLKTEGFVEKDEDFIKERVLRKSKVKPCEKSLKTFVDLHKT